MSLEPNPFQAETIRERAVRVLRETREQIAENAATSPESPSPLCPSCQIECRRFTGRHSGRVFVSHPDKIDCPHSDRMFENEVFLKL